MGETGRRCIGCMKEIGEELICPYCGYDEKTADGVKVTVEYEYHIIFTEEEAEKMERLKYNGKEAVGYEEIQQREAE